MNESGTHCICGQLFQKGDKFCPNCGEKIDYELEYDLDNDSDNDFDSEASLIRIPFQKVIKITANCPYCNKEMESGSISSRRPITWRKNGYFLPFAQKISNFASDTRIYSNNDIDAFRCDHCRKIIIDF